jgi:hypothetical protein
MGWSWCIQFIADCDEAGCYAAYHDGGRTVQECVDRARAEGWSISRRASLKEPDVDFRCFCPKHHPHCRGRRGS